MKNFMNTYKTILVGLTLILLTQCTSEEINLPRLDKVDISLDLLDSNNESKRVFKYGEEMVLAINLKNQNEDAIRFTYSKITCHDPILDIKVTDKNDIIVGDFLPDTGSYACTLELIINELNNSEELHHNEQWQSPVTNSVGDTFINKKLEVGSYTFSSSFSIQNYDQTESRDVDLELSFEVVK
jgi:hypothetical protein